MRRVRFALALASAVLAGLSTGALCATWSAAALLTASGETNVKDPHVCAASSGGFHAIYKPNGMNQMKYRRYQSGVYSTPAAVPITAWAGGFSDICEAMNGDIWVTWENWAEDSVGEQVWAARSADGGQSWTSWNLTQYQYGPGEGGQGKNPNIVPYGMAGSTAVVATNARAVYQQLTYSVFNGSTWSPTTVITDGIDNFYCNYGVARHPLDGSVYRLYGKQISGVWQLCMRRFDGASWGPEQVVSASVSGFIARPSIAINHTGRIMLVWDQDGVWSREYNPEIGWGPQVLLSEGWSPAVTAMPGRNEFYAVWSQNDQIYGKRYRAGSWESSAALLSAGQPNGYTLSADIAACTDGMLVTCWENHGAGGPYAFHSLCTDFVVNDATAPPAPANVIDDGAATDSTSDLHFAWSTVTDPESGIDRYEYCIGTSAGSWDVRYWSYAGTGTEFTAHGLSLSPGTTYYVTVRAVNRAGKEGAARSTDGILCDPTVNTVIFGVTSTVSTSTAACDQPMLAASKNGGMHLVYREAVGSSFRINYRKVTGDNWSASELASNADPGSYFPDVAEDPLGNVHVIFASPGGRESNDIYECVRTAGGWSAPALAVGYGTLDWYPKLAPGVGSELANLVVNGDNGTHNVKHSVRTASGWSPPADIASGAMAGSRYGIPDIATDAAGNLYVVYGTPTEMRFIKRAGGVWSAPVTVAVHSGTYLAHPRIALDSNGLAHIVYADHNVGPDAAIYYVRQTGPSTWAAPRLVANGFYPAIAVDKSNRLHIVYGKTTVGGGDIFHKVLEGGAWSQEQNLSNNSGSSDHPQLRMDNEGNLHVVWQDSSTGVYRIMYRRTVPEPPTCAYAKGLADATIVDLQRKIITAVFSSDGCIYIEEPNRTSGIRVTCSTTGLAVGDLVNVSGSLGTRTVSGYPSERVVSATSVNKVASGMPLAPYAMTCRAVGGAASGGIPGVKDGTGANNMGLLVKVAGKVTRVLGSYIFVDDGSRVANVSGSGSEVGVMVRCPSAPSVVAGDVVSVTGVTEGSVPTGWTTNRGYIRLRDMNDLVKVR